MELEFDDGSVIDAPLWVQKKYPGITKVLNYHVNDKSCFGISPERGLQICVNYGCVFQLTVTQHSTVIFGKVSEIRGTNMITFSATEKDKTEVLMPVYDA